MRKHTSRRRKTNKGSNRSNNVDHNMPQEEVQDLSLVDEYTEGSVSTESQDEPVVELQEQDFEEDSVDTSKEGVEEVEDSTPPKKKKGLLIGVGVAVICVVAAVGGYVGMMKKSEVTSTQTQQDNAPQVALSNTSTTSDEIKEVDNDTESKEPIVSNDVMDSHKEPIASSMPIDSESHNTVNHDSEVAQSEVKEQSLVEEQSSDMLNAHTEGMESPVQEGVNLEPPVVEVDSQVKANSEIQSEFTVDAQKEVQSEPVVSESASPEADPVEVSPVDVEAPVVPTESVSIDEKLAQLNAALKEAQESLLMKEEQIKILEQKAVQKPEQMHIMLGQVKQYILSAKRQVAVSRVDLALDNVRAAKALIDLSPSTLLRPLKEDLDVDMVELKALGAIDRDILYVQLDEMTHVIDHLSFVYPDLELKGRPVVSTSESDNSSSQAISSEDEGWFDTVKAIPSQVVDFLSSDMKGMVRVEKADTSVSLMSMEEATVLKERMK